MTRSWLWHKSRFPANWSSTHGNVGGFCVKAAERLRQKVSFGLINGIAVNVKSVEERESL